MQKDDHETKLEKQNKEPKAKIETEKHQILISTCMINRIKKKKKKIKPIKHKSGYKTQGK